MSQTTQTPAYIIPPQQTPLVDNNGIITRVWWRYLQSLFVSSGSGTSTLTLAQLIAALAALQNALDVIYQPRGQDLHNAATIAQARQIASWGP